MRVAFVAPAYMNPRQKKEEDSRRRKKRGNKFDEELKKRRMTEIPEDSTISYYV